jgi:hypothetical protein
LVSFMRMTVQVTKLPLQHELNLIGLDLNKPCIYRFIYI